MPVSIPTRTRRSTRLVPSTIPIISRTRFLARYGQRITRVRLHALDAGPTRTARHAAQFQRVGTPLVTVLPLDLATALRRIPSHHRGPMVGKPARTLVAMVH